VLAQAGCSVAVADVNMQFAEETAALVRKLGRKALALKVDVRDYHALEQAAKQTSSEFGALDFCVANAGIVRGGSVLTMEEQDFDNIVAVNMKGVFSTVKACSREMVKHGRGGRVIVISSANAEIAGAQASAYCGTKAAVRMMVRCWAQDLVPFGITVNCIGPGATETALMVAQVEDSKARQGLLEAIPVGRMAHPDEIGWLSAFYCSDEAAYLTGTFVLQDGGLRDHSASVTPEVRRWVQARTVHKGEELMKEIDAAFAQEQALVKSQREKHNLQ